MGYIQYIIELVGKEKLKEYNLGGISAGATCAGIIHTVINSDQTISDVYLKRLRKCYGEDNLKFGGFISNGELIYKLVK